MYVITALFLSTSYFWSYVFRVSLFLLTIVSQLVVRVSIGDDFSVIAFIFTNLAYMLMIEVTIYINVKAQLKLFVLLKRSEREQMQLANLLNTMPDNVLICTKGSESQESQGIYANL